MRLKYIFFLFSPLNVKSCSMSELSVESPSENINCNYFGTIKAIKLCTDITVEHQKKEVNEEEVILNTNRKSQ